MDLIRDAGYGILATVDQGQPKARPMMPYLAENGDLWLAILAKSRTIQQIQKHPDVEICYVDRKMCFARVKGRAAVSEDADKKSEVWENIPMLRQYFTGPEDPHFKLIDITTGEVEVMTPHMKDPLIVSLKG